MIVCICKAVNDQTIRREWREGKGTLSDLKQGLGVGGQCGQCVNSVVQIIQEEAEQSMPLQSFLQGANSELQV